MNNAIIPRFLFDEEAIIYLRDQGISIDEGVQTIGKYKVKCYRFNNLSEVQVFDILDSTAINEADNKEADKLNFASRMSSVLFLSIRQVAGIKDKTQKITATCSLIAAVNSLAELNIPYARRFIPLVRGLI